MSITSKIPAGAGLTLMILVLASCEDGSSLLNPSPGVVLGSSSAMGLWTPSGPDTCSRELHDQYSTVGPDSLLRP
jgi:hypothetical protein